MGQTIAQRQLKVLAACDVASSNVLEVFAKRIHPRKYQFSPRLAAMVGAIIGYDYGVRDGRGGHITSLSFTSDGFVIGQSTASSGGGAFLGTRADLKENIDSWLFHLDVADARQFRTIAASRGYKG